MDAERLKLAKDCEGRIFKMRDFIRTTSQLKSFCNGYGVSETPEATEACKKLLIDDLSAQLSAAEKEFSDL